MKTKTLSIAISVCALALFAFAASAYLTRQTVAANDGEKFEFGAAIEHPFGAKSVKGAPFSAQVIIENSQTLASGVHISRKMAGALYRDSEGRTRQELPRDGAPENVLIDDGIAGVRYSLNMFRHTVNKMTVNEPAWRRESEERARAVRVNEEREMAAKARSANNEGAVKGNEPQRKVESLGVQVFEGVQAEVTRFTITIPAGAEGNDQPFDIVSERWYSPELQVAVMGKRSDPRMGEMVYRLANVNRSEPAHSLFEAPADFTASEEKTETLKRR